jgi:hypothetical protein
MSRDPIDRRKVQAQSRQTAVIRRATEMFAFLFWSIAVVNAEPARLPLSSTNIFAPASTPANKIFGLSIFVLSVTAPGDDRAHLAFPAPQGRGPLTALAPRFRLGTASYRSGSAMGASFITEAGRQD